MSVKGPLTRLYWTPVAGVGARQAAQCYCAGHEAEIGVRFTGRNKLVYLIGLGEAPLCQSCALERLDRAGQIGQGFTDGNQAVLFAHHVLSFSHDPQTKTGTPLPSAEPEPDTGLDTVSIELRPPAGAKAIAKVKIHTLRDSNQ